MTVGLDAVVYRNKKHINMGNDEEYAKVDPVTGEVYFEDAELSIKYYRKREAIARRLGNISAIAELDAQIIGVIGRESVIGERVLYSGAHSGDAIPVEDLHRLSTELVAIRQACLVSSLLHEFVAAMEELVKIARDESNPIVFV